VFPKGKNMDTYDELAQAAWEDHHLALPLDLPRECASCRYWRKEFLTLLPVLPSINCCSGNYIGPGAPQNMVVDQAAPCGIAWEAELIAGNNSGHVWMFTASGALCDHYALREEFVELRH
jgi:hypothetical protein